MKHLSEIIGGILFGLFLSIPAWILVIVEWRAGVLR